MRLDFEVPNLDKRIGSTRSGPADRESNVGRTRSRDTVGGALKRCGLPARPQSIAHFLPSQCRSADPGPIPSPQYARPLERRAHAARTFGVAGGSHSCRQRRWFDLPI